MVIDNATIANEIKDSLNPSEIIKLLPSEITNKINFLADIAKVIGILFLIYIIFLIIKSILNIIEKRRIKKIYNKVYEIDEKLDLLLERKGIKEKKKKN